MRRLRPGYGFGGGFAYNDGWMDQYRDAWQLLELNAVDPAAAATEE